MYDSAIHTISQAILARAMSIVAKVPSIVTLVDLERGIAFQVP